MSRAGFTLAEVLVAMLVASIGIGIGYGSLQYVADAHEKASARSETIGRSVGIRSALRGWLGSALEISALPSQSRGEVVLDAIVAYAPPYCPNVCRLRLLSPRPAGFKAEFYNLPESPIATVDLDTTATVVEIRFFSDGKWRTQWHGTTHALDAVEIRVRSTAAGRAADLLRLPLLIRRTP